MMLLTLCLSSLLLIVNADTSVHILSNKYGNGQLVTSSILNWIPESHYSASKTFVIGGFENVDSQSVEPTDAMNPQRPIFVCRALHNGIWVAGGQKEGDKRCTVTVPGSVRSYDRYQLLENVESAARLSWTDWTKYIQIPVGAVATGQLFVARHVTSEAQDGRKSRQTHYVGTLNAQEGLGMITYVKEDNQEGSANNGQLLVETEPVSYELTAVKLVHQKRRVVKREARVLGQATISNPGSTPAKMAEAFGYSYLYFLYWGQGHAMLKALNTSVTLQNKTQLPDIKWGIEIRENKTSVYTVEVYLEPGTAVNVTLRGDYAEFETPYSGTLYSIYEDGATTNPRSIGGFRREMNIIDIGPEFGPIYYLSNHSLVPTTIPPPTTEPTATTTTSTSTTSTAVPTTLRLTPTTIRKQQQADRADQAEVKEQFSKENALPDENAILSKRPEATGMQGDDGGPLSLQDKTGAGAGAGAHGGQRDSGSLGLRASGFLLATAASTTLGLFLINRVT